LININFARWQTQLKNSIISASALSDHFQTNCPGMNLGTLESICQKDDFANRVQKERKNDDVIKVSIEQVTDKYPMRITPYYLSLIKAVGDPIWRQAVPDIAELSDTVNIDDPLHEEPQSPVPSIIHRYPDRVIFLVSNQCAMYCRHCMRKRKVGQNRANTNGPEVNLIDQGLNYIGKHREIHDVILSGGDPLLLTTEKLDRTLFRIRQIDHVQTIRIHTRTLCTLPFRITDNLASVLEKYHPLYINTHFNHPDEITYEAARACAMLSRAGIPLGCQTVLLKGVNDTPQIMTDLMRKLIRVRVKPYYLHHPDAVEGTAHFRPSFETGLRIMKAIRGNLTGIAVPQYMIDLPGGYGKVPVLPDYIKSRDGNKAVVENYQGRRCEYTF